MADESGTRDAIVGGSEIERFRKIARLAAS